MAKPKKKGISDVKMSKPTQKKKQNPFEVHINREKFKVLGKNTKFDKGLPGVARAKAIKKRKETLLQEYKIQDKSNRFIDRRIGERNKSMTKEDRIIARFTAERMKSHKRKTLFNLAEEEVLTHKGRSITEVERFDDPRSDNDDDEELQSGNLNANFVEEAHFGGGVLTKSVNSRESVIDQLIADSKKRKAERQQMREKTLELTEKLDTEWRDLVPLINSSSRHEEEEELTPTTGKAKKDPYDIALRELKFEARGIPTDKLKSEEEIAEEEAKKLQKLEEERQRRMRGDDTQVTVTKWQHNSADALEDNFQLDDEQEFSLMYDKEGNIIPSTNTGVSQEADQEEAVILRPEPDQVDESDDEEGDKSGEKGDSSDEEDDDESVDEHIQDLKTEIEACNQNERENSEDEFDDEGTLKEDNTSEKAMDDNQKEEANVKNDKPDPAVENTNNDSDALNIDNSEKRDEELDGNEEAENDEYLNSLLQKYSISEETDENALKPPKMLVLTTLPKKRKISEIEENLEEPSVKSDQETKDSSKKNKKVCFNDQVEEVNFGENSIVKASRTPEDIRNDLLRRKELMDKARQELPYTYQAPKSYEELEELLKNRDHNEVTVIVERIIKCNHPKLREENKLKMMNLFAFLMQYLNDLDHEECWLMLDRLIPFLFDVMMFSPPSAAECLVEILKEKQSDYAVKKHKYPGCSTLIFLKLVPLLFPPSDKRHPVTTPALVFLTQMLQTCKVNNRRSISTGLLLVSLVYEYVHLSKRICPQVINFLVGLLHLASPANVKSYVLAPFKEEHRFLYLHHQFSSEIKDWKLSADELSLKSSKIDDEFRVKSLLTGLNLLDMFLDLYSSHQACSLLFINVRHYLSSLEVNKYPKVHEDLVNSLNGKLNKIVSGKLEKLSVASKKPKVLRLYEPAIEPVYDTKKKKGVSAEASERDKLVHKIKRERKGALREIRRDRAFIAKIKFKQQQKSDAERMQKVKQIYGWGAQQQGEMNAFQRLKNKKH